MEGLLIIINYMYFISAFYHVNFKLKEAEVSLLSLE